MRQTPVDYVDRFGFTRHHELLSSSTTTAAAPLALVSAPQATFEVTTLADVVDANDGVLSLREAITLANDTPGRDTITFHESLFGGTIVVNPQGLYGATSYLPPITDDLLIDGDPLDRGAGGIVIDGTLRFDDDNALISGVFKGLIVQAAEVQLEDLTITGAEIGISADESDLYLNRVAIDDNNEAPDVIGSTGIGIRLTNGTLVLTDSSVSDNNGLYSAGIAFAGSQVEIDRTTIAGNGGDFAAVFGDGTLSVRDSTIADNLGEFGIAIAGDLTLINSTVAGNGRNSFSSYSPADSGGVKVFGSALIVNSTLAGNYGSAVVVGNYDTKVELQNSIVDGAFDGALAGTISSNGHNIFTERPVFSGEPGDVLGVDPSLVFTTGALADNGGPTQTIALRDSFLNPAIDGGRNADAVDGNGVPLGFDQRGTGFTRISEGSVDIGAFEFQGPLTPFDRGLVVTTLVDEAEGNGLVSLREAVLTANETAGLDTITFAEAIRGGTIELLPRSPLTITDDLVIDGDPLDRGPGGITISGGGEPLWGGDSSPGTASPLELRGGSTEISVTFEDMTIADFEDVNAAIDGSNASVDLTRATLDGIRDSVLATGIRTDGFVELSDSSIKNVFSGFADAFGVYSDTGISMVDSEVVRIGGVLDGIALYAPTVSMLRSSIDDIYGEDRSIGIAGVDLTIVESTISNVTGGGTYDPNYGAFNLGFAVAGFNIDILNSTIAENSFQSLTFPVGVVTGGVGSIISIRNSTIANNAVGDNTYGVIGDDVTIINSIVLGNGGADIAPGTIITSNGHNIFGQPGVVGTVAGDVTGVDPSLVFTTGVLADNGGPTQTIALRDSFLNPAIDAGSNADAVDSNGAPLAFDQRGIGFPRISEGSVDIGAFEFQGSLTPSDRGLVVTTLEDEDEANGLVSLREAILTANETPGLDTITFAEEIRGGTIVLLPGSPLTITDDLVIDGDPLNRGSGGITISGGGVDFWGGFDSETLSPLQFRGGEITVSLEDLTISDFNEVRAGIDGFEGEYGVNATLELTRTAITDISATSEVIAVSNYGDVSVRDSTVSNISGGFGGASGIRSNSYVRISDSRVEGIYGAVTGIGVNARGAVLVRSTIDSIGGEYESIGIRADDLTIRDSTISNVYGGGTYVDPNTGEPSGFGHAAVGFMVDIFNSTIAENSFTSSPSKGVVDGLLVGINNSTIANNSFGDQTYGVSGKIMVHINNSIVLESIVDFGDYGGIISNGHNIFGQPVAGAKPGDIVGADPALVFQTGVLADNGGPTQTIALKNSPLNPALDNADPADAPPFDQRGFPRDATPDIGAFELGPTTLPPLTEGVRVPDSAINGVPREALTLTGGRDAAISFVDEYAGFQNSLGVYLVGPDGEIMAPRWVFERIEHALPDDSVGPSVRPGGGPSQPGDTVWLSDLYDPAELQEGTEFGLFVVADGAVRNPFIVFDGGTLEFRSGGGVAKVTDTTPELVHIAETGVERALLGDIMHTVDAGSPNPLSNKLNPPASPGFPVGGRGQALSGLLDGEFTIAFEDVPFSTSDKDFNDVLVAVDLLDDAPTLFAAPASGAEVASLDTLLVTETAA